MTVKVLNSYRKRNISQEVVVCSRWQRWQAGESCEIKWMFGNADVMNFLERYGIKEGSRIRVLGRVLDGLIIGNGKVRLALGDEVAERIQV